VLVVVIGKKGYRKNVKWAMEKKGNGKTGNGKFCNEKLDNEKMGNEKKG
jgi:hypothetical protein